MRAVRHAVCCAEILDVFAGCVDIFLVTPFIRRLVRTDLNRITEEILLMGEEM